MPDKCILCANDLLNKHDVPGHDLYDAECRVCGSYRSGDFKDLGLNSLEPSKKAMLSAYIRNLTENSIRHTDLSTMNDEEEKEIVGLHEKKKPLEKLNNFILHLGNKSEYFGFPLKLINDQDYPLTYSVDKNEFENIRSHAEKAGLILNPPLPNANVALSWKGWEKYEELRSTKELSNICFVAMHLDGSLDDIYLKGIIPAIRETEYKACRSDREEFNEDVFDWIILNINRCRFMIADFTNQRPNVYLEAGYARGLGKPVIHTCKRDQIEKTHFDVRQNNFICWDGPEDLKNRLSKQPRTYVRGI